IRTPQNMARALTIERWLPPEDLARLRAQMGVGRSESYVSDISGEVNKAVAEWWSKITDDRFRYASFLYYAHAKGYHTADELHALLTKRANRADLADVSERGRDALANLDRMSQYEKATVRHYIFVYPWQRAAFFWSFRTIMEHPAKTALLSTLG